jgi:hypothetical protein
LTLQSSDLEAILPNESHGSDNLIFLYNSGGRHTGTGSAIQGTGKLDSRIFLYNSGGIHTGNATPDTLFSGTLDSRRNSSATSSQHPSATCWEILTLRLGRFARKHIEKEGASSITDEIIQTEARRILYDSDDPWNQTAADNPEWLGLFKQAHGIDTKTPYPDVIAQHEILEDLGVRPNAQLDRSFNLNNFECVTRNLGGGEKEALAYECSLSGSNNMSQAFNYLSTGNSSFTVPAITSAATSGPGVPAITGSLAGLPVPMSELADTVPSTATIGADGEISFSDEDQNSPLGAQTSMLSMPPLQELPCTTTGASLQDHFAFANWDQMPKDFNLPSTTAAMSSSMPIGIDLGTTTGPEVVQGMMDDPQVMRWDDNELSFDMDMDLDLNMNMDLSFSA